MICKFCGKTFESNLRALFHINNVCNLNCDFKYKIFFSQIYGEEIINDILIKYQEGQSIFTLSKLYNISRGVITTLLNEQNIKVRNIHQMCNNKRLEKIKRTCLKKFGVDNASKSNDIKEKKKQTFLKHYGIDNVRKCKDFRQNHGYNKTMLQRYGKLSLSNRYYNKNKWWNQFSHQERQQLLKKAWQKSVKKWKYLTEQQKNIIIQKRKNTLYKNYPNGIPVCSSKLEYRILNICKNNNIKYVHQYFINRHSYDFKFEKNIILEIQGDYWHANPLFYKGTDVLNHKGKNITASQLWQKDKNNKILAEKYGYKVFYLWENDINKMKDEQILDYIKSIINERNNYENLKN